MRESRKHLQAAVPLPWASIAIQNPTSASPLMPSVRTSVNAPHASKIAATIDARRRIVERPRPIAADPTRARLRTGRGADERHESHHAVRNGLVNET